MPSPSARPRVTRSSPANTSIEHAGWDNRSTLSPAIATFPKIFRAAGYHTKAVGKMHFTPTYLDVGFDEMLLAEQDGPGRWDDDYHRYLMRLGLVDRNDLEDQRSRISPKSPAGILGQLWAPGSRTCPKPITRPPGSPNGRWRPFAPGMLAKATC